MASRSDCYAQYRRERLTRPIAPSPITYVEDLYGKLYQTLSGWIQEEIKDDMGELAHMIDSTPGSRTTGDNVFCMYVLYSTNFFRQCSWPSAESVLYSGLFIIAALLIVIAPQCTGIREPLSVLVLTYLQSEKLPGTFLRRLLPSGWPKR